MGQKVHPTAFRIAYNIDWQSKWFMADKKGFAKNLLEDYNIRKYIKDFYKHALISRIEIERRDQGKSIIINIFAEKP